MLRFKNLGSGSAGNATLIEASSGLQKTYVLIDCGIRPRDLDQRLALAGLEATQIQAIFITHEHSDHIGHAKSLAKKTNAAVWMSHGTWMASSALQWGLPPEQCNMARDHETIAIGDLCITPFTVPHDAREPLQLTCTDGDARLGILTDLGHASSHVIESLKNCNALLLEANHDEEMLSQSQYPYFLKQRIAGPLGHLSNTASAQLLAKLDHEKLNLVVAAHLSEKNNSKDKALESWSQHISLDTKLVGVADPLKGCEWYCVGL